MGRVIDMQGKRFGKLSVGAQAGVNKHGAATWHVVCDCGVEKVVIGFEMRVGHTKSCGCLRPEIASKLNLTHGMSRRDGASTYTYRIWAGMRSRCNNPTAPFYVRYGGAGIGICERWDSFENFVSDMGEVERGMSLDRIDPSKGYSPENCRWATAGEQCMNRRIPSNNTSGFKNVQRHRGAWIVRVRSKGVRYEAGPFDDVIHAAEAAKALRDKVHGVFANHQ